MKHDPMDENFDDEDPEPENWMWVRGVDYAAGWRNTLDAATELKGATGDAGIDATEFTSTAANNN
ncbi:hypothetical protein [Streptomyces lydicus]|uniref:hypothetical protein n=1 Tax=Streptomyces lydicus TaxID=47763 RepID=UPI0036E373AD